MKKSNQVAIDADGSMSAKTSGIKGARCIEELEQLLDQLAEVDDVEHTREFHERDPVAGFQERHIGGGHQRAVWREQSIPMVHRACALEAFAAIGGHVTTASSSGRCASEWTGVGCASRQWALLCALQRERGVRPTWFAEMSKAWRLPAKLQRLKAEEERATAEHERAALIEERRQLEAQRLELIKQARRSSTCQSNGYRVMESRPTAKSDWSWCVTGEGERARQPDTASLEARFTALACAVLGPRVYTRVQGLLNTQFWSALGGTQLTYPRPRRMGTATRVGRRHVAR